MEEAPVKQDRSKILEHLLNLSCCCTCFKAELCVRTFTPSPVVMTAALSMSAVQITTGPFLVFRSEPIHVHTATLWLDFP